jgi:integrase
MNHQSDRVLVRLLAFGGLRINECFALQWSDVDLERKTLTVRQSVADVNGRLIVDPTKTYATRTITLPDAIRAQLLTLKNSKSAMALVFPGRDGVYRRYGNWRRDVWDPACETSSVTARPNDLRAACASLLIDAGPSPKDVQAHLGHESGNSNALVRPRPPGPLRGSRHSTQRSDRRGRVRVLAIPLTGNMNPSQLLCCI